MKKHLASLRADLKYARTIWGNIPKSSVQSLRQLIQQHGLIVTAGDVQLLDGRWYITGGGLLRIATRRRCAGIDTALQSKQSDPTLGRFVFKATVYKFIRGFVGYGDADPSNVSPLVRGAEMRIAETRAVNRALRKAYGIGLCSVEELGWSPKPPTPLLPNRVQPIGNKRQRPSPQPAASPRSALPPDSAIRTRPESGQSLRRPFLRHRNDQRCQPRPG